MGGRNVHTAHMPTCKIFGMHAASGWILSTVNKLVGMDVTCTHRCTLTPALCHAACHWYHSACMYMQLSRCAAAQPVRNSHGASQQAGGRSWPTSTYPSTCLEALATPRTKPCVHPSADTLLVAGQSQVPVAQRMRRTTTARTQHIIGVQPLPVFQASTTSDGDYVSLTLCSKPSFPMTTWARPPRLLLPSCPPGQVVVLLASSIIGVVPAARLPHRPEAVALLPSPAAGQLLRGHRQAAGQGGGQAGGCVGAQPHQCRGQRLGAAVAGGVKGGCGAAEAAGRQGAAGDHLVGHSSGSGGSSGTAAHTQEAC